MDSSTCLAWNRSKIRSSRDATGESSKSDRIFIVNRSGYPFVIHERHLKQYCGVSDWISGATTKLVQFCSSNAIIMTILITVIRIRKEIWQSIYLFKMIWFAVVEKLPWHTWFMCNVRLIALLQRRVHAAHCNYNQFSFEYYMRRAFAIISVICCHRSRAIILCLGWWMGVGRFVVTYFFRTTNTMTWLHQMNAVLMT